MLIAKLHAFADRIGVKPAVFDTFIATVTGLAANWIIAGHPFDVDGLKVGVFLLILGVIGAAAPPAAGVTQEAVVAEKPELQEVTEQRKARKRR